MCFPLGEIAQIFSEGLYEIIKTIAHNTKRRRPRFSKKSKAFFIIIRYRKTSQTQDVKSRSTERSVRKIGQPKRDSAFEQKTRIVSCREISAISQNNFFSYNQRKKQSRAQTDIFGTYLTSFRKVCVFVSVKLPNFFRKVWTKIIKTIAHNTQRRTPRFRKNEKLFFKYSISQDLPKAGCKEPKYQTQHSKTSAGKSQHCSRTKIGINSRTLTSRTSHNTFSFTTRETSQAQLKPKTLGLPQRHFKKKVNWFWWHWPTFFKDLYRNLQKECTQSKTTKTTFPQNEELFFQQLVLYISNTRLKTHYQTKLSTTSAAQTWLCIWTKGTYCFK